VAGMPAAQRSAAPHRARSSRPTRRAGTSVYKIMTHNKQNHGEADSGGCARGPGSPRRSAATTPLSQSSALSRKADIRLVGRSTAAGRRRCLRGRGARARGSVGKPVEQPLALFAAATHPPATPPAVPPAPSPLPLPPLGEGNTRNRLERGAGSPRMNPRPPAVNLTSYRLAARSSVERSRFHVAPPSALRNSDPLPPAAKPSCASRKETSSRPKPREPMRVCRRSRRAGVGG
jgi:hypothetical protein